MKTLITSVLFSAAALAATTITDTINSPFGIGLFNGTLTIACSRAQTGVGGAIAGGTAIITVTNGAFTTSIAPYDTTTPSVACSVTYNTTDTLGNPISTFERWIVPTTTRVLRIQDVLITNVVPFPNCPTCITSGSSYSDPVWLLSLGFAKIVTGTNTGQILTVGNGSNLTYTGTGIINATSLLGVSLTGITGLVKMTAGVPSTAVAGTDYSQPATAETVTAYRDISAGRMRLPEATFAATPTSPVTGQAFLFTDAISSGTCSGGGTAKSYCRWNGSSYDAIGGGASNGFGSTDLQCTKTSAAVLTCNASASASAPVVVQFGATGCTFTSSSTITTSAAGALTALVYVSDGSDGAAVCTLKVRNSTAAGLACTGCTVENSQTTFPGNSIPMYKWTSSVAAVWDTFSASMYVKPSLMGGYQFVAGTSMSSITQAGNTVTFNATTASPCVQATFLAGATTGTLAHNLGSAAHVFELVDVANHVLIPTTAVLGTNSDSFTFPALSANTICTACTGGGSSSSSPRFYIIQGNTANTATSTAVNGLFTAAANNKANYTFPTPSGFNCSVATVEIAYSASTNSPTGTWQGNIALAWAADNTNPALNTSQTISFATDVVGTGYIASLQPAKQTGSTALNATSLTGCNAAQMMYLQVTDGGTSAANHILHYIKFTW